MSLIIVEQLEPVKMKKLKLPIPYLIKHKQDVITYKFKGVRFDFGSAENGIETTNYRYKHNYLSRPMVEFSKVKTVKV
ncbi:hypothetical protein MSG34_21280 [Vibrio sp. 1CM2L]|uniref:hypothetical protein n=1 Tax=Vibrio sp. 1CM2L TaxID=2929166 RepID=UPI0020BF1BB4|nr:hypothetical protein [Vibrio sp. 1CM2L]MCK8078703.1 hypothetical protein [Vibrio sp. 1CM2L]